jgi:tetratricopeptide (TPR) repeat protein
VVVPREDRAYLTPPDIGWAVALSSAAASQLAAGHAALVERGEAEVARRAAEGLLADDPGLAPAAVLAAQVEYLERSYAAVRQRLEPLAEGNPTYTAAWLLFGRNEEQLGDVARAYAAYRHVASVQPVAAVRADELRGRAVEIVANRLAQALDGSRLADAERSLDLLRTWGASEPIRLEGERAVARAKGDRVAELAAVKGLIALTVPPSAPRALVERRAELEVEVGDAGEALKIYQQLDRAQPGDPALGEKLARARFRWRLQLLPREVRELAASPELTRGDFAALLYWLVPEVRRGQPSAARIASDVLDHPQRDAIVRVVNLGLLDVDETLHRFSPERPIRRGTALAAVLRLLALAPRPTACAAAGAVDSSAADVVCARGVRCGLLPSADDCLPGSSLEGAKAVEWIGQAVEILGGT